MSLPVHIVGYGRFGAALADLFLEAGHVVRASDPAAEVPAELSGPLPAGPAAVVLCVPVQAVGDALAVASKRLMDLEAELPREPGLDVPRASLFRDTLHFSDAGMVDVAETVAAWLEREGLVPG